MSGLTVDKWLALIASVFGLLASVWGFLVWLRALQRKQIEAERQLANALNNFAAVSTAIGSLDERLENLTLELAQIKTLISLAVNPAGEISMGKVRSRRGV